ncbi:MAG: DNA translocase FtsK [Gemmatimonadetes bacterium]|nr:DNA translocase FtsK [Gemmatimonadota bacterium]
MLTPPQRRELLGLALLALALFLALSLLPPSALGSGAERLFPSGNIMGLLGGVAAAGGLRLLGAGFFLLPLLPALGGAASFGWIRRETGLAWGCLALALAMLLPTALWLAAASPAAAAGGLPAAVAAGWLGRILGAPLLAGLGWFGGALTLLFLFLGAFVATVGWNPARAAARGVRRAAGALRRPGRAGPSAPLPAGNVGAGSYASAVELHQPVAPAPAASPQRGPRGRRRQGEELAPSTGAHLPPLSLLSPPPPRDASLSDVALDQLGDVLMDTLRTFKVEGQIVGRTTGPVVTQFEVVPAAGIKVNRIAALDADLALALRAASVRIVAPIPGKGAVGVEVPNPQAEVVYLRELLESPAFERARGPLPLALGKDLTGRAYVADLVRMPHLLIAGATGSGKSVCINTLITSLMVRHSPSELRLLLIDPKRVELSMYSDLPHLRHPVVTDPHDAAAMLKWAVLEMDRRYALLGENGARSMAEFNRRVLEGQVLRRAEPSGEEGDPDPWLYGEGALPYIVLVVDELADLMMTVQAEVERPLAQLAQKARAIGIHLIVATQRPSVNVITGLIKANFSCRIAFRVSSKVDSRTILDQNGADALLGNGDMLFLPPGRSDPVRLQGAYLSTEETERLMAWYRDRMREAPAREADILEFVRAREAEEAAGSAVDEVLEDRDPLFRQAAEICVQFRQGSTSLLQRRLRIGYGRAARLVDQLHHAGVLGPADGSKPREVLVGYELLDSICGRNAPSGGG